MIDLDAREYRMLMWLLNSVTNNFCTCGGGSPEDGCVACKIYHEIGEQIVQLEAPDEH